MLLKCLKNFTDPVSFLRSLEPLVPDSENGGIENVGRERLDDPIGIQQQSDNI